MQDTKHAHDTAANAARRGRPSLHSEDTLDLILMLIRARGLSDSAAATRAGLSPATLSRWKKEHPELALHLAAAREDFRDAKLAVIENAKLADGRPDWRAAAWLLERTFPEDYSRHREPATFGHVGLTPIPEVAPLGHRPWQDIAHEIEAEQGAALELADEEETEEEATDDWNVEADDLEDTNSTEDEAPAKHRPSPAHAHPAAPVPLSPLAPPPRPPKLTSPPTAHHTPVRCKICKNPRALHR